MNINFFYKPPSDYPKREDVVGVGKQFLDDIIINIQQSDLFEHVGIQPNKIYLLEGPPGTGKTFSVDALNNTLNERFYREATIYNKLTEEQAEKIKPPQPQVYFFPYDTGNYGTAFINRGSRIVQAFFNILYLYALKGKKVVAVMDEADSILTSRRRSIQGTREDTKVLETFMKNLQEAHDTQNIYVILMTNYRQVIDEAVLRAGRIDQKYVFELPDYQARKNLFKRKIDTINEKAGYKVIRQYDLNHLARITEGYNGADIVTIIEKAIRKRCYEVAKKRTNKIIPALYITQKRLEKEIEQHTRLFKEKKKQKIGFNTK